MCIYEHIVGGSLFRSDSDERLLQGRLCAFTLLHTQLVTT